MLHDRDRIFTNIYGIHDVGLKGAKSRGDWDKTADLVKKVREWIVEEMKASGLRGRGVAGFGTGMKWSFMPKEASDRPHYLVVNADEGEPGTFKDRYLLETEPEKVLRGMLIAAQALNVEDVYFYLRDEYPHIHAALGDVFKRMEIDGVILHLCLGAGAYICGEDNCVAQQPGRQARPTSQPPALSGQTWL